MNIEQQAFVVLGFGEIRVLETGCAVTALSASGYAIHPGSFSSPV